jgi:hypothetical protein
VLEFELEGKKFRCEKMDTFKQFAVLRRLGALFPTARGAIDIWPKDPMLAVSYMMAAFSKLSDEDANYLINACLAVCKFQQGKDLWVDLMTGNTPMFNDMELPMVLQICWKVLEHNFGSFTQGLLSKLQDLVKEQPAKNS